jgi:hypothetical protein
MKKKTNKTIRRIRTALAAGFCLCATCAPAAAQDAQAVPCGRTYGGPGRDVPQAMAATADGGAIVAGFRDAATGWDASDGDADAWIVKLDAKGDIQWTATYGDTGWDGVTSIIQTPDGGYLAAGVTGDYDMNLAGIEEIAGTGAVNENQPGDVWLLRLDAQGGQVWARSFGRSADHTATHLSSQAPNGSFSFAAAASYDDTLSTDIWFATLDPETPPGRPSESGGRYPYTAAAVAALPQGGAVVAGSVRAASPDKSDIMATRIDASGRVLWTEPLGTTLEDHGAAIAADPKFGYAVAGYVFTQEPGTDTGSDDFYAVLLDRDGKKLWSRTLPAKRDDRPAAIAFTDSGGVLIAGNTFSGTNGFADMKLAMLGNNGEPAWDIKLGTTRDDRLTAMAALPGKGFLIAATTRMPEPARSYDFWILTLDNTGMCINP